MQKQIDMRKREIEELYDYRPSLTEYPQVILSKVREKDSGEEDWTVYHQTTPVAQSGDFEVFDNEPEAIQKIQNLVNTDNAVIKLQPVYDQGRFLPMQKYKYRKFEPELKM